MITCPTDKLQKVLLGGACEQNGTPTPDTHMDIICNNGVLKYWRIGKNLVNPDAVTQNSYIDSSGGIISDSSFVISDYIPVQGGQKITISTISTGAYPFGGTACKAFYNSSKNYISSSASANSAIKTNNPVTLVVPANAAYFRTSIAKTAVSSVQVEYGDTATTFEPYKAGIYTDGTQEVVTDNLGNTANAEMLLAVGDYKDTQEVLSGSVTRNVVIKVLDGTENWGQSTVSATYRYRIVLSDVHTAGSSRGPVISTHFKDISSVTTQVIGGAFTSGIHLFIIPEQSIDTVDKLKVWLADQYANGTPVIIVYPLATPTTEQVTPQPLAGSSATVTAGSIDNLPIETSNITELKKRYIGDKEVKKVYIGENIVYNRND